MLTTVIEALPDFGDGDGCLSWLCLFETMAAQSDAKGFKVWINCFDLPLKELMKRGQGKTNWSGLEAAQREYETEDKGLRCEV